MSTKFDSETDNQASLNRLKTPFFWKPSVFIPVISVALAYSKKYTYDDATHNWNTFVHVFFLNFYFRFFWFVSEDLQGNELTNNMYTLHFFSAVDLKQSFRQDRDFNRDSANYILLEAKLCSNWATTRSLVPQNNSFLSAYFNNF